METHLMRLMLVLWPMKNSKKFRRNQQSSIKVKNAMLIDLISVTTHASNLWDLAFKTCEEAKNWQNAQKSRDELEARIVELLKVRDQLLKKLAACE